MKNKKLTFLLIVSVAAVWGIIFYRIFAVSTVEDSSFSIASAQFKHSAAESSAMPDSFTLTVNYRDPFLDDIKQEVQLSTISNDAEEPDRPGIIDVTPHVNWEFIRYSGYVINPGTRKKVAIVFVNGKEQMLEEGEKTMGVRLLKNLKDSIKVSYQNQIKYISLK